MDMWSKCTCLIFEIWFHYCSLIWLTNKLLPTDTHRHRHRNVRLIPQKASSWLSISHKRLIHIQENLVSKPKMTSSESWNQAGRKSVMLWRSFTTVLITKSQNGASSFFLTLCGMSFRSPSSVMCVSLSKEIWQGPCKEKEIKPREMRQTY